MASTEDLDPEYVAATANQAVVLMARHAVPPTPNNFSVWFEVARGGTSDLKRAVKILIDSKRKFDSAVNRDLFYTYCRDAAPEQVGGHNVSQQLLALMGEAKNLLAVAITDNRTHIRSLGEIADQTEQGADTRSVIENLVTELAKAAGRASALEARFVESSRELGEMRESLEKAEYRANTDILTGLLNRRAVDDFFRSAQTQAMETGRPLSILLIDIDHFKKFNDNFGHGVGDQVLKLIAKVLSGLVRENDLAARYGGEELIAVLPDAELAACEAVAERIRRAIFECRMTRRSTGELLPVITVSIGVAQFRPGESMTDLIDRCDRALYRAKHQGRNRVLTEIDVESDFAVA